jgi:hypothetical protein
MTPPSNFIINNQKTQHYLKNEIPLNVVIYDKKAFSSKTIIEWPSSTDFEYLINLTNNWWTNNEQFINEYSKQIKSIDILTSDYYFFVQAASAAAQTKNVYLEEITNLSSSIGNIDMKEVYLFFHNIVHFFGSNFSISLITLITAFSLIALVLIIVISCKHYKKSNEKNLKRKLNLQNEITGSGSGGSIMRSGIGSSTSPSSSLTFSNTIGNNHSTEMDEEIDHDFNEPKQLIFNQKQQQQQQLSISETSLTKNNNMQTNLIASSSSSASSTSSSTSKSPILLQDACKNSQESLLKLTKQLDKTDGIINKKQLINKMNQKNGTMTTKVTKNGNSIIYQAARQCKQMNTNDCEKVRKVCFHLFQLV